MKMIVRLVVYILIVFIAIVVLCSAIDARADYFVLCKPGSEINVRAKAKLKSPVIATAFFGQRIKTDGQEKNGFVHAVNLNAETCTGWIYKGLLVEDEPIATGGQAQVFGAERVACRKYADGKVIRWAQDGENVRLYAISADWCVTDRGYLRTDFLTVNAPVNGGD